MWKIFISLTIVLLLYSTLNSNFLLANDSKNKPAEIISEKNLKLTKLEVEIEKLRAEILKLRIENEASGPSIKRITAILGAVGGLAGALAGFLIWILGRSFTDKISKNQDAKLQQDKELSREIHNLELFRGLSDENPRIQLAAASVLMQRLLSFRNKRKDGVLEKSEEMEQPTILQVLLAITKEDPVDDVSAPKALWKLIADNLVIAVDAIIAENKEPSSRQSPLISMDFQKSHLANAWWKRVDARGVDFFKADLSHSGMAESFLMNTIFYQSNLEGSVLRKADLRNADLRNANIKGAIFSNAKLEGADLTGAKYNSKTIWPDDFDYKKSGAVLENNIEKAFAEPCSAGDSP